MGQNILIEEDEVIEIQEEIVSTTNANYIQLPSGGKLGYQSKIEYRDMLVQDEERLASSTPDFYATTINSVLKSVLLDNKDFENFTLSDRDYAMVWIWANNYTPTKKVGVTCVHCKNEFEATVDLTKLPVTEPRDNFIKEMELPISKTKGKVKVKLNRVRDELAVEEYMKKFPESSYD